MAFFYIAYIFLVEILINNMFGTAVVISFNE